MIGKDQITRIYTYSPTSDPHIMGRDIQPAKAVGRMNAAAKNREAHFYNGPRVACVTVDYHPTTATIARGRREEFSPKAPIAGGNHQHLIRLEGIDRGQLAGVRTSRGRFARGHRLNRERETGCLGRREERPDIRAH